VIKVIFCIRKLHGLTDGEFQRYWREDHADLVRQAAGPLNIRRYVQSHAFSDQRLTPMIDARGIEAAPYDGIAELWWDDMDAILAAGATKEGRAAGRRLLEDEKRFIDLKASPLFYAYEHEIIALTD
jgi:uncharacterized protein (TIGR02118 family)